jgi:hypothetical protein
MRGVWVVVALVGAAGCADAGAGPGGSDGDESARECADRSGVYLFKMTEKSGDCGPVDPELIDFDRPSPTTCKAKTQSTSADNCDITSTIVCTGGDATVTLKSVVHWSTDGSIASGTATATGESPTMGHCSSVYSLSYVRQ